MQGPAEEATDRALPLREDVIMVAGTVKAVTQINENGRSVNRCNVDVQRICGKDDRPAVRYVTRYYVETEQDIPEGSKVCIDIKASSIPLQGSQDWRIKASNIRFRKVARRTAMSRPSTADQKSVMPGGVSSSVGERSKRGRAGSGSASESSTTANPTKRIRPGGNLPSDTESSTAPSRQQKK